MPPVSAESEPFTEAQQVPVSWQDLALDLVLSLAQRGEIDPWDVDLVFLIDKFLAQINPEDLQGVAEIIFCVSVLLRIKSERISKGTLSAEEEPGEGVLAGDDLVDFAEWEWGAANSSEGQADQQFSEEERLVDRELLDRSLVRNPKQLRKTTKRQVTLEDLVAIFQTVERAGNTKKTSRVVKKKVDWEEVVLREEDQEEGWGQLAHEENLEEKIALLSEHILKILEPLKQTPLHQLEVLLSNPIDTFLSALFLSHSGKTQLIQERFYEDLWIQRLH